MKSRWFYICNYVFFLVLTIGCAHKVRGASEVEKKVKAEVVGTKAVAGSNVDDKVKSKKVVKTPKVLDKQSKGIARIKGVLAKYRLSSGVSMALQKTVYLALMETEKIAEGLALLSKGMLRLELKSPDYSLMVMSPKTLWMESRFNENVQVSKISMKGKGRRKGLIGIFFDKESIWDGYRLVGVKTKKGITKYSLKPLKSNKSPEAEKVEIDINRKKKVVVALTYWDDLENRTAFLFSDIKFDIKPSADKFKYTPPKGVEVTEY